MAYIMNNDYNHGAHPEVLKALMEHNDEAYIGYGMDPWCEKAEAEIKKYLDQPQAKVHFLLGGTQTNYTAIAAMLKPYQSVICAESGHVNGHETGAVENTGHKLIQLPHENGKITAEQIDAKVEEFVSCPAWEHITQPKMVYISYPTEFGTLYSKDELVAIRKVCDDRDLYLFVDGARLAYGLAAGDVTLKDIAAVSDAFYCGGTKCGTLFGEALVLNHPAFQDDFRYYIKQNGAMLAKGWVLGLQFYTMFKDGLYFDIGRQAIDYAEELKQAFVAKGVELYIDSPTNQQFIIADDELKDKLSKDFVLEYIEALSDGRHVLRFCTSWSTKREDVDALLAFVETL